MSGLPTRAQILRNALRDLERANLALSDARDWLNSDWQPIGSPLTDEQAEARTTTRRAIEKARREIEPADYALRGYLRAAAIADAGAEGPS